MYTVFYLFSLAGVNCVHLLQQVTGLAICKTSYKPQTVTSEWRFYYSAHGCVCVISEVPIYSIG